MTPDADSGRDMEPHPYQRSDVPQWRTCRTCGRGANAQIHRPPTQDEMDAISGSAYTHALPHNDSSGFSVIVVER